MEAPLGILLLCVMPAALGYTSGPPVSSNDNLCTDMVPDGHNGGVSLATDQASPPYAITTSTREYYAGAFVRVTITGSDSNRFTGFFIQARRADTSQDNDVAVGTFSGIPANTQLLMCHGVANSAWGHSNKDERSSVTATWNAPNQDEGPVEFLATIVKGEPNRNYFYLDVKSPQVNFTNEAPPVSDGTTSSPSAGSANTSSCAFVVLAVTLPVLFAMHFN
ncbi:putative defense protein Hdd11 [Acanthaster planci]|uniref:Defense protein Hdd11 n=1 Tax=Acanthaster planci TaxID=133434 RepID=A0A8B7YMD3_ACAPL|nr:putative defense protein Hdd11 [Acanthaster planci]XP_022093822.1 putative defense protein Hdd11 [Acanthaster planci]